MNNSKEIIDITSRINSNAYALFNATKKDAAEIKLFFDKWNNDFVETIRSDFSLAGRALNAKSSGIDDKKIYILSSNDYNNYNFDYLKFISKHKKIITDIVELLEKISYKNFFGVVMVDQLFYWLIKGERVPEKIKNSINLYSLKGEEINKTKDGVNKFVGEAINFEISKDKEDLILNEILEMLDSGNLESFHTSFIAFLNNVLELYKKKEIDNDHLLFINDFISSVLTTIQHYDYCASSNFEQSIKPSLRIINSIEKCIRSNRFITEQLINDLEKHNLVFKFSLKCDDDITELKKIIEKYNIKFKENSSKIQNPIPRFKPKDVSRKQRIKEYEIERLKKEDTKIEEKDSKKEIELPENVKRYLESYMPIILDDEFDINLGLPVKETPNYELIINQMLIEVQKLTDDELASEVLIKKRYALEDIAKNMYKN